MIWRGRDDEPPGAEQPPADPPRDGVDDPVSVGGRIESIIDAAERAATGIREDAEERARSYYEESKRRADEMAAQRAQEMTALTDTLMERARQVASQSDQLISALEEAGRRMLSSAPGMGSAAPKQPQVPQAQPPPAPVQPPPAPPANNDQPAAVPPPPQPGPPAQPAPAPASPPPTPQAAPPATNAGGGQVSEGARLLATQMAIAGSSRDDIARRLRDEFGVLDPTAILNEIGA